MRRRALLFLLLAACGDDRLSGERDPMAPPAGEPPGADAGAVLEPTYLRDIAPILTERCGSCHVEGGVAPFSLATYDDAHANAAAIAAVTAERIMPPWPADASGACGTFVEPRWLSDRELALLAAWEVAGAPLGDPEDTSLVRRPVVEPFSPTVELAPAIGYVVRPGPDEYRCFVLDPALPEDRYITALAMRLDRADVVHHMQLFAADGALGERTIDEREALDPEPGYACDREVGGGLRYVGVWAGGDAIRRWPDGTGIRLAASHRLVLQLHYHNHGSVPVLDRTGIALELAADVTSVGRITSAQAISFALPPGQAAVSVAAELPLPVTGTEQIRGARIHMHGLGTAARLEVVRAGHPTCVLEIPRWQVGWQLFYRFAEPLAVAAGDQVRIRCTYDTRTRSEITRWGNGTDDEMCIGYTFLAP